MPSLPVSSSTSIAQFAGALFDVALDNASFQAAQSAAGTLGLDPYLNQLYSTLLGSASTVSVAQAMTTNMGLTGSAQTAAETFIISVLDAAAPDGRGSVVDGVLALFSGLTGDPTFGQAATAWNTLMTAAVQFGDNPAYSANVTLQNLPGPVYSLTPGTDHLVVTASNSTVDGVGQGIGTLQSGYQVTFNAGDSISAGNTTGNTLNLSDASTGGIWNVTGLPYTTVSGMQTVNLTSGEAVDFAPTLSLMGFAGLNQVNITSVSSTFHTDVVVVGPGTAVVVNDQAQAGLGYAPYSAYGTMVTGGSSVSISESNGSGYGNAQHNILVSGGAATAQVSVSQTESSPHGHLQGVVINDNFGTMQNVTVNGLDNFSWSAVIYSVVPSGYGYGYGYSTIRQFYGGDLKISNAIALKQLSVGNMSNGAYANVVAANVLTSLDVQNVSGAAFVNLYNPFAKVSTLNLSLSGINGSLGLYDQYSVYRTLNISTVGDATLDYTVSQILPQENLQALNISGSGILSLAAPLQTPTMLTRVTLTGAAGLDGDLSNAGSGATVIDATQSSGAVTLWLDGTQQQVFMGGSGPATIMLNGPAAHAVNGGSGAGDEVVINFAGTAASLAQTASQASNFEVLGVTANLGNGTQSIDLSGFTGDAIHTLDVQGGASSGTLTFTRVAPGTALQVDAGDAQGLVYQTGDSAGPSESLAVTLGTPGASTGAQTRSLTLQDAGGQGIGALTLTTQGAAGFGQSLGQLTDLGLTQMTLGGTQPLVLTTLTDNATTLSLTDDASGNGFIHALGAPLLTSASISSASPGSLTVGDQGNAAVQLSNLTLSGTVNFSLAADQVGTGVTVNGAGDSGNVQMDLVNGAGAGFTDQIALGNGNNQIEDGSAQGQVAISVGSGNNVISLAGGGITGTITLAGPAAGTSDRVVVGPVGYAGNVANLVISGFQPGIDQLQFSGDIMATTTSVTTVSPTAVSNYAATYHLDLTQLSTWVNGILATGGLALPAHGVAAFQFGGNTYVLEQAGATGTAFGSGDTLVMLSGLITLTHL